MVVAPGRLKHAEFELEATIVGLRLELARHTLRLSVLENLVLRIPVLPSDVAETLVVHIVLVHVLILDRSRKQSHFDIGLCLLLIVGRLAVFDGDDTLTETLGSLWSHALVTELARLVFESLRIDDP